MPSRTSTSSRRASTPSSRPYSPRPISSKSRINPGSGAGMDDIWQWSLRHNYSDIHGRMEVIPVKDLHWETIESSTSDLLSAATYEQDYSIGIGNRWYDDLDLAGQAGASRRVSDREGVPEHEWVHNVRRISKRQFSKLPVSRPTSGTSASSRTSAPTSPRQPTRM
jgi:hypothetical protein